MKNRQHRYTVALFVKVKFAALFICPLAGMAQPNPLPWLQTIAPKVERSEISAISTQASVQVSDGLTYNTQTLYHDPQRAIFRREYADRTVTQGVEGKYIWSFEGDAEKEISAFIGDIILGHQFHAQILFFDKLHPQFLSPETADFSGQKCLVLKAPGDNQDFNFYYQEDDYPVGIEIVRREDKNIVFKFLDWRDVDGVQLPFIIEIDDGSRQFEYRFDQIKFNAGSLDDFRAPENVLNEEQKLMRCHRVIMDGHLFGETAGMKAQQSDTMTMINSGEIEIVLSNQPDPMIDRIMASRDYTVYDDLVRPQIKVSEDGTLGWVTAQIHAEGVRFDENGQPTLPLEFTCAWTELYQKEGEAWKMTGIISTFK